MATFKIGQRVRIQAHARPERVRGMEGVIVANGTIYPWVVTLANTGGLPHSITGSTNDWSMSEDEIAPLTDPGADAFMERIKNLQPLDTYTEHFAEVWRELTGIQR